MGRHTHLVTSYTSSDFTSILPSIGPTFRTCNSSDDETSGRVTPSSSSMQYSHLWQHHYQHALEEKKRPDPEMKPCPVESPSSKINSSQSLGRNAKPHQQPPDRVTKRDAPTQQSKHIKTSNQQPSRVQQKDPPATTQPQHRHKSPLTNTDQNTPKGNMTSGRKKSKPGPLPSRQNSHAVSRPKQQKQTTFNEECLKSAAVLQREEDELLENVKHAYRLESEREKNWRRESLVADPVSILNAVENDGVSLLQALQDHDRAPSKTNEMHQQLPQVSIPTSSAENEEDTVSTLWIKTDGVSVVSSLPCESMIYERPVDGKEVSQDISLFSTIEAAKQLKESSTVPTLDATKSLTTSNSSSTQSPKAKLRTSASTKESTAVSSMTSASTFVGSIGPLTVVDSNTGSPDCTVDESNIGSSHEPNSLGSSKKETLSDVSDPISELSDRSNQRLTADQMVEAALAQAQEMKHSRDSQGRKIKISSPFVDDMVRDIVMNAKGSQSRSGDSLSSESTDLAFDC